MDPNIFELQNLKEKLAHKNFNTKITELLTL